MNEGVGRHAICELWGAKHLDSPETTERALRDAVTAGGATLIEVFVHQFSPHGVSGVAVIAESHVAVHTWPELGYVAADVFTCGERVHLDRIVDVLRDTFEAESCEVRHIARGLPAEQRADRFEEREPAAATSVSYRVDRVLERRRTPYQDLFLFESEGLGKVLVLDGIVQLTERDAYVYHELLAHPALFAHPLPRRVAIVGGGDAHLLAEVLKHDEVECAYLLELDGEVVEVARKHFDVAAGALSDPRAELMIGDAFESVSSLEGQLDVILCDLTDPIGQAARLFEDPFYARCERALTADGMLVAQTESLHYHRKTVQACFQALSERFPLVSVLSGSVASYPGAWWTFTLASKGLDPRVVRRRPQVETRLYQPDAHGWFFVPEPVLREMVAE